MVIFRVLQLLNFGPVKFKVTLNILDSPDIICFIFKNFISLTCILPIYYNSLIIIHLNSMMINPSKLILKPINSRNSITYLSTPYC